MKASQKYKDAVVKNNEARYPYDEVIVVKEVSVSENEDDIDNDMEDDYEDWEE